MTCEFYSAIVSRTYDPQNINGVELVTKTCYSTWGFENDLTSKIIDVTGSPGFGVNNEKENAIDGLNYFYYFDFSS